MNDMKNIKLEKITLNIATGEPGENLDNAKKVLEEFTGKKAVKIKTKKRNTFGIPKGREIAVKVTLRNKKALEILKRLLEANEYKIKASSFSDGTFSFGINEHIDVPGLEYDPKIGIFGMDVTVTLERPGYRVKKREIKKKIGKNHRINSEETKNFAEKNLEVKVI